MEPFGMPKRLASFPRLHPATKSRLSSVHVCFCNLRAMACVILRVQTIVLMLSRLYNSNLSAALTMQSSKVNRTGLEKSRTGLKTQRYARVTANCCQNVASRNGSYWSEPAAQSLRQADIRELRIEALLQSNACQPRWPFPFFISRALLLFQLLSPPQSTQPI